MGAGGAEGRRGLQGDRPRCGLLQVPGLVQGSRGNVMGSSPWLSSDTLTGSCLALGLGPWDLRTQRTHRPSLGAHAEWWTLTAH